MNEEERYLFDLNGYLVVEDVLNSEEIDSLNEAIDSYPEGAVQKESPGKESDALKGKTVREDLDEMLMWPKPWCQPFRDLIEHPKVVPYLTELLGEKYLLDHLYGIMMSAGAEGLHLHGGGSEMSDLAVTQFFYRYHQGTMRNGLTVATFMLADEGPGDGGFMCVPGSHKSNFPMPEKMATLDRDLGITKEVTGKAGSVILFTESLAHGTLPWQGTHQRRAVLYKYTPGTMHLAQNYLHQGVGDVLDEFTPAQRARMNPTPSRPL